MSSKEILARYNVDVKELGKSVSRYERLLKDELRNDAVARGVVEAAWSEQISSEQASLDAGVAEHVRTLDAYRRGASKSDTGSQHTTVKAFANALSEICFMGEAHYTKLFAYVRCSFGASLAAAVITALSSPSRVLRLLGLLAARLYASDEMFLTQLVHGQGTQWLALCFDRDNSNEVEYALGFILRVVDMKLRDKLPWADALFPQALAYRLASMLDPNDQLNTLTPQSRLRCCRVAVQVLEAFPQQAAGADLVRILLAMCVTVGTSADEYTSIIRAVLTLYDDPARRSYLRDAELATLFVPFFDASSKATEDQVSRMNQSREVLSRLLCSWPGLFWVASESMCLRSLADVLHLPGQADRKMIVLNLLQSTLATVAPHRGIPHPSTWQDATTRRRASTQVPTDFDMVGTDEVGDTAGQGFEMYLDTENDDNEDLIPTTKSIGHYTSDAFCASLLLVWMHHGIPQALITIAKRTQSATAGFGPEVSTAASVLLQHVLVLMDNLLPPATVSPLHSAFNTAVAGLSLEQNLSVGTLVTSTVMNVAGGVSHLSSTSPLYMDDAVFQANLKESHVEQHAEPGKWNFDVLLLLVQGPLRVPSRVRWARDNTRFFTRILGFYKPSALKSFATLKREECTDEICGFGVAIVETLLGCKEGSDMLERADFPKALKTMLQEIVDVQRNPTILTWERMGPGATKVGAVFLTMLGRFTQSANGLQLLRRFGVLDSIWEIIEKLHIAPTESLKSVPMLQASPTSSTMHADLLSEVAHRLLRHLHLGSVPNFGVCAEIRKVAEKALLNRESNSLRLCALSQLRKILWRDLSTAMHWGIQRLVDALSDTSSLLIEQSFRMLASICCSSVQALDYLISLKPMELVTNKLLKENSKRWSLSSLLYRMAGRREGVTFLAGTGYIQRELDLWFKSENAAYCEEVERMSQGRCDMSAAASRTHTATRSYHSRSDSDAIHRRSLASNSRNRGVSFAATSATQNYFPIHLVGELCRTPEGCELVQAHPMWRDAVMSFLAGLTDDPISPDTLSGGPMMLCETSVAMYGTLSPIVTPQASKRRSVGYADDLGDLTMREPTATEIGGGQGEAPGEVELLSAARGYDGIVVSSAINLQNVDLRHFKQSLLLIANASSCQLGIEMVATCTSSRGEILRKLVELSHSANILSLRGTCIIGLAILSRSPSGAAFLADHQCAVVQLPSAYVSSVGLPYSVAFAHGVSPLWMGVERAHAYRGHAPRNAYIEGAADSKNIPKDITDNVVALSNPVNREAAKQKLHSIYKEQPSQFLAVATQRLLLDATNMYRLRAQDRKFIADLLQRSMTAVANTGRTPTTATSPAH